jgi:hypothetical protein
MTQEQTWESWKVIWYFSSAGHVCKSGLVGGWLAMQRQQSG